MRKVFILSLFVVLFFQSVVSQQISDSISVDLNELHVNANRNKLYSEMGRVLTVIDKIGIQQSAVQSIDQLLDLVAGIDIRQRGTNTTQADISVRGGSFDQVLVLLNGINITDPQTGHFNLDTPLSISEVNRIEILQGSAGRLLGPNAFSGAINIVTEIENKPTVSAEITGGSFNTVGQSLSVRLGDKNLQTFATASYKSSDGYLDNTDFEIMNAFSQSILKTKSVGQFTLQTSAEQKAFGANSFYSLAYPNQFENTKTFTGAMKWDMSRGAFTYNAQINAKRNHDRFELFRDNEGAASWYKSHNYHMTDVLGGKFIVSYLSKIGKTTLGVDIRNEHIFSNVLGTAIDSVIAPLEVNGFFTKESTRLNITRLIDHSVSINHWYFSAGAALTSSTTFGSNSYGGCDIAYAINDNIRFFVDANTAVRLPTFTDLYYNNANHLANPDLQPEKSQTIEAGTKIQQSDWNVDATVYKRFGQNVIDWTKAPDTEIWQSRNLTNVNAIGTDISLNYLLKNSFVKKVSATYSYVYMDKSASTYDSQYVLDYLRNKALISINHSIWTRLSASWMIGWYDRAGNYTDLNKVLQGYNSYSMLDCRLFWTAEKYSVYADVNNLLDVKYADYGGLTQPGINFNVGVKLKL